MRAMALHRRMAEPDHLPECFAATNKPWACPVCDALRACEQRKDEEHAGKALAFGDLRYSNGFSEGVQAARDAVEQNMLDMTQLHIAFAAIDALAEHKSRSGYDPRATDERP